MTLRVHVVGLVVSSNSFGLLPLEDLLRLICKNKPVTKQSWTHVKNGLIQVFTYSKNILKPPVE